MNDLAQSAQSIGKFLQAFIVSSGLRLRFRVKLRSTEPVSVTDSAEAEDSEATSDSAGEAEGPRTLYVEFTGPDTGVLTANDGEVLSALEHVAIKILRLEPESHDQVSFDADHFKADRDRKLQEFAAAAIERVRSTGRPHPFPAMNSRERRTLHLILSKSGLPTASSGEGPGRFVVLYPAGEDVPVGNEREPHRPRDASHVRSAFRHR